MIRPDYKFYLDKLKNALRNLNIAYVAFHEEELCAQFSLNSDWILELDCERFGSGVTISIINRNIGRKDGYALWILMKAFENLTGKRYGNPSIENQVNFINSEKTTLFNNSDFYEKEYAKLNDVNLQ